MPCSSTGWDCSLAQSIGNGFHGSDAASRINFLPGPPGRLPCRLNGSYGISTATVKNPLHRAGISTQAFQQYHLLLSLVTCSSVIRTAALSRKCNRRSVY